jgi:hypothetical protein
MRRIDPPVTKGPGTTMRFLISSLRRQLLGAFLAVTAVFLIALLIGYSAVGSVQSKVQAAGKQSTVLAQA